MQILIESPNDTLSRFAAAQSAQAHAVQLAEYRELLAKHDWAYRWADDGDVYQRGREQRVRLEHYREHIDPDYEIWNACCADEFKNGGGAL